MSIHCYMVENWIKVSILLNLQKTLKVVALISRSLCYVTIFGGLSYGDLALKLDVLVSMVSLSSKVSRLVWQCK